MASLKDLAEGRSAVFSFDPRKLVVRDGWNARDLTTPENAEHVEGLAISIEERGVLQPLTIIQDGEEVCITDGFCRHAATMLAISRGAEILTVPCIAEPRGTSRADQVASQLTRNSGKPLSPLEQGAVYKRLIGFGWTTAKIATAHGKSVAHVNNMLQMQEAPPEVQALVAAGEVSATLAAEVIRSEGSTEAVAALGEAVKTAKAAGKKKATKKHVKAAPKLKPAEVELVGGSVEIAKLKREIAILVAALRKIAKEQSAVNPTVAADTFQFIAREALIDAGLEIPA